MAKNKKGAHSQWYDIWRAMMSNKLTVGCLIFVGILVVISLTVDLLFNYETQVITQNIPERLQAPSLHHWFGTDAYGRDYFARVVYATRITMIIAICSTLLSSFISLVVGAISGFYGGQIDNIIQRILDVIISVPQVLLIICVIAVLGGGVVNLIIALTLSLMPLNTRIMRSTVMVVRGNEYTEAARSVGASNIRIIFSHLVPNSIGPLIVQGTMAISGCILATAGMGYLGLGVPAPQPEWGLMLSEAQVFMRAYPYMIIIPGLAIVVSALVFNMLGDGLRDAMDPRLRGYRKVKEKKSRLGRSAAYGKR